MRLGPTDSPADPSSGIGRPLGQDRREEAAKTMVRVASNRISHLFALIAYLGDLHLASGRANSFALAACPSVRWLVAGFGDTHADVDDDAAAAVATLAVPPFQ